MYFEKITYEQYQKDNDGIDCFEEYQEIELPKRATSFSAGYDFFSPFYFELEVGETITIPTGIKIKLDEDKFLLCAPRSGHGFKYRIQLDNTIGIIDSDFYDNKDNEGHIKVKLTNDGKMGKKLVVKKGEGFCQGIILPYFLTEDDNTNNKRVGGFGSTNNK